MGRIRTGLVGVVYAVTPSRDVVMLRAGDVVPDGVSVGLHVLEVEPEPAKPVVVEKPEPAPKRRGRPPKAKVADDATSD